MYFQPSSTLPKPEGRLSTIVPSSSIAATNKEVKQILDKANKPEGNSKHGAYEHFTLEEKAHIAKRAADYGVTSLLLQTVYWPIVEGKYGGNVEDEVPSRNRGEKRSWQRYDCD